MNPRLICALLSGFTLSCGGTALNTQPSDGGLDANDGSALDVAADRPNLFPESGSDVSISSCNAHTCPTGCCDGQLCVTTISPDQCGASGQACAKCAPGDLCKGVCVHPQTNCGPSNCPGCCLGSSLCASGIADVNCGNGGQQCMRCVPTEGTGQCIAIEGGSGGVCTDQQCGPQTCLEGCCSNGVCLSGQTEMACGTGGVACQACGPGEFCHGDNCRPGTPCTNQNCAGCCQIEDDGGACLAGSADNECGQGGATCQNCTLAQGVCASGVCSVPCSPTTCHGCCDGNICAEGDQNFLCGAGGVACTNCETNGQTCSSGSCH